MIRLADWAARTWLRLCWRVWAWRLVLATRAPMRRQRRLLARILRTNRDTTFGRAHGFDRIRSHADFIARVPVGDYETLRPSH
uniref:GH3 family domain-containing protein n=1 Tax=Immundisolibacter sp. TaxID=1934948 RepID=UPI0035615C80